MALRFDYGIRRLLGISGADGDAGTLGGKGLRKCAADPSGSTGNQKGLAL